MKPKYLELPENLKVPAFNVPVNELNGRFDASYHLPEVHSLIALLRQSSFPVSTVGEEVASIRIPPRFKRIYVEEERGIRYLRPSDMVTVRPLEDKFLSKRTKELPQLRFNEGEVLIATDGAVGRLAYTTSSMDGWVGSNNIGRIRAGEKIHAGYLLAFLATPYGQFQLKREIYGSVINHLEIEHIANVELPMPDMEIQEKIGEPVIRAYELRDQAQQLEQRATKELEALIKGG